MSMGWIMNTEVEKPDFTSEPGVRPGKSGES